MAPLTPTKRFFQPEISDYYFLPAVADPENVTRAEIGAGTLLSPEIADISGFSTSSTLIDTPDLGSRFVKRIGGRTTTEDSSLTFYASRDGVDVRAILPRSTEGYLYLADGGDEPGSLADLFHVEVTSVGKVRSTGDQAMQLTISFGILSVPVEDLVIPAAA